jgi:3-carboxy-cis,cis-muconate cycloisomerase
MVSLFNRLFDTDAMSAVWSDESLVQTWLETEVAISRALCEAGLVPAPALAAIEEAARIENIDLDALAARTRASGMPIKPLIDQVVAAGNEDVARYFHWSVTTQDVLDTGQALRIRSALGIVHEQLSELTRALARDAEQHRATPMVARTNAQDASVTTWGLQVAGYVAELARHLERWQALTPRATIGMFGGAVGTLAALGTRGRMIRDRVLEILELERPTGAWNGSQDQVVELVQVAALVQGTLVRYANDVELMGRAALGEIRRSTRQGASSTMPHKTNPRDANMIQTHFQLGAMYAGQAIQMMDQMDVRAAKKRVLSWKLVPEALGALSASLERALEMTASLVVDEARMRANFDHSRQFVMSEAVMFVLAKKVGRDDAYRLVKQVLATAEPSRSLLEVLKSSDAVRAHLSVAEIEEACQPEHYLGCTDELIEEVLTRARTLVGPPPPRT